MRFTLSASAIHANADRAAQVQVVAENMLRTRWLYYLTADEAVRLANELTDAVDELEAVSES